MKIYTRTGDDGETGLYGGGRLLKCDPRIAAYGSIDELNAQLGWCRSVGLPAESDAVVAALQHGLFAVGAELASPQARAVDAGFINEGDVAKLEGPIDHFQEQLPELRTFVLPGGTAAAAALHVARTVCRRAERDLVQLAQAAPVRPTMLQYVNRVSDLLFVLARQANRVAGVADVPWEKQE